MREGGRERGRGYKQVKREVGSEAGIKKWREVRKEEGEPAKEKAQQIPDERHCSLSKTLRSSIYYHNLNQVILSLQLQRLTHRHVYKI